VRTKLFYFSVALIVANLVQPSNADLSFDVPDAPLPPGVVAEKPAAAAKPTKIVWLEDMKTVKEDPTTADRPMLVFVTAPGCEYCVLMHEETFTDKAVIGAVAEHFTAFEMDAKKHAAIAKSLKVKVYPTTAVIHPSGRVVDMMPGFQGPAGFLKRIQVAKEKLATETKLLAAKKKATTIK